MFDRNTHLNDLRLGIVGKLLRAFYSNDEPLIFFDIGACEGVSSVRYVRNFLNAEVYSVEPLPSNVERIKWNIDKTGVKNVHVVESAFTNSEGEATLHVSGGRPEAYEGTEVDWDFGNKSSSLLPPDKSTRYTPWLKFENEIPVSTQTLNIFCRKNEIDCVHFMHLDVQGAELKVLKGAGEMLRNIDNIWLEVETVPLYRDQPLKKEVQRFLKDNGFRKIVDHVYGVSGDQFWSRRDFLQVKTNCPISIFLSFIEQD